MTNIPFKEEGETLIVFRPSSIFFRLTPASISNLVFSDSTNKQLPTTTDYRDYKNLTYIYPSSVTLSIFAPKLRNFSSIFSYPLSRYSKLYTSV